MLEWFKNLFFTPIVPMVDERHPLVKRIHWLKEQDGVDGIIRSPIPSIYLLEVHYSKFEILIGIEPNNGNKTGVVVEAGDYFGERGRSTLNVLNRLEILIGSDKFNKTREDDIGVILDFIEFYVN